MFSVTDRRSFQNIANYWIPEISAYSKDVPFVVIGNKIDKRESSRNSEFITFKEGAQLVEQLKKEYNVVAYIEISALVDQRSVDKLFNICARIMMLQEYKRLHPQDLPQKSQCNVQ